MFIALLLCQAGFRQGRRVTLFWAKGLIIGIRLYNCGRSQRSEGLEGRVQRIREVIKQLIWETEYIQLLNEYHKRGFHGELYGKLFFVWSPCSVGPLPSTWVYTGATVEQQGQQAARRPTSRAENLDTLEPTDQHHVTVISCPSRYLTAKQLSESHVCGIASNIRTSCTLYWLTL